MCVRPSAGWPVRFAAAFLISPFLLVGLWSSVGRAQDLSQERNAGPVVAQTQPEPKKRPRVPPPSPPKPGPVVQGTVASGEGLGAALSACDKGSDASEPLSLPGAKGEIKLDRCYRGRDHLVCSFNALLREAKAILEEYSKIVDSDYPNFSNVSAVCSIKPDSLAADLSNAAAFDNRFKVLKNEYNARASCASKVEQSLRDVTLPDMFRASDMLKSMVESLQGDIKDITAVQKQVLELADKIDASQKAMITIRKIHRTMCTRDRGSSDQRTERANRTSSTP
jgi:hypothetical protein